MQMRDIIGIPVLLALLAAAVINMWVLASPRVPIDVAYRTLPPSDPACAKRAPKALLRLGNKESYLTDGAWACYYQSHTNRDANFDLAIIEFGEDGRLLLPAQKEELMRRLAGQKTILATFVHGWRHDARRGNRNLEDFRILLSYIDMYRRQRCGEPANPDARYCDHKVVGLFLAWRGASILEKESLEIGALSAEKEEEFAFRSIPAYLSFAERKVVADGPLSAGIGNVLREISDTLRAQDAGISSPLLRNRVLIAGHSLGGNILLNAFGKDMVAEVESKGAHNVAVGDVREKKLVVVPPAGDLIVLLNPAAEARKWTVLQHAARKVASVADDDETNLTSGMVYSARQPPVMISYTSTCDWGELTKESSGQCGGGITPDNTDRKRCDWVTSRVFRLFKQVDARSWKPEETIAVGHLLGKVAVDTRKGIRVGATHEAEINKATGLDTNYWNAGSVATAPCTRIDGIYDPSEIEKKCRYRWDLKVPFVPPVEGESLPNWQMRRGVLRGCFTSPTSTGCKNGGCRYIYPELTPTRDPFWNVRVINDVIAGHNAVFHHHLWCGANQFLLDRTVFDLNETPKPAFPGPPSMCATPAGPAPGAAVPPADGASSPAPVPAPQD